MLTVSIVIPVFNVAEYLRAALDSLCAQTFSQWTAICVDDGSTDGSGAILDEYAVREGRIRVIHQANSGVSAARNVGLEQTTGDVIAFMDPDDVVASDWLERMIAELKGSDAVLAGYALNGSPVLSHDVGAVYAGDDVRRRCWQAFFGYRLRDVLKMPLPGGMWKRCHREMAGVWRLAVRREALGGVRFDPRLSLYEDAMFLAKLSQGLKSLVIAGDCGYGWQVRSRGAMTRQWNERMQANKFLVRDVRREIDPEMTHWRGTFLLSALEIFRDCRSVRLLMRYLRGRSLEGAQ